MKRNLYMRGEMSVEVFLYLLAFSTAIIAMVADAF